MRGVMCERCAGCKGAGGKGCVTGVRELCGV